MPKNILAEKRELACAWCHVLFETYRAGSKYCSLECKKEKWAEYCSKWKKSAVGKLSSRKSHFKRTYGLSVEDYETLFQIQNGCCAICEVSKIGEDNKLYVDHDHNTGHIRGLLCMNCNAGLGMFRDTPELMLKAAFYVESHEEFTNES